MNRFRKRTVLLVLLVVVSVVTAFFFTLSMVKVMEMSIAAAKHPLEAAMAPSIFGFYELLLIINVSFLLAAGKYLLIRQNKTRTGMVFAFGLALVSGLIIILSWLWMFCIWSGKWIVSEDDLIIALFVLGGFPVIWISGRLVKRAVSRKRRQPDTPEKEGGYRKYLQSLGAVFALFTLAMLLASLRQAWLNMSDWDEMRLPWRWYLGVIVHGGAWILASVEMFLGIRFLLHRSCGKAPVGALLLSSSCLGYFVLWCCMIYTISGALEGTYYDSYAYANTILCVAAHRLVTPVLALILAAVCKRKCRSR